jgi:hypothetical protein
MSELDFNVSCSECCPYGYDVVSNCSRTNTDVALHGAEWGQAIGAVFLVLFSYLLAANAREVVRIVREPRTVRHKRSGMLTVFGLGAGHALSRIYLTCTVEGGWFLLFPGTPELPQSVETTSRIMGLLGMQALLSEVAFAILVQLRLLRSIRNPFKRYGSPFVKMAAVSVCFGSAMFAGLLIGHSIYNISLMLQMLFLTYLSIFSGRALERALLLVDKTGTLEVDPVMRKVMIHHRQVLTPLGLLGVLDTVVLLCVRYLPVTQETRTVAFFVSILVPRTIELLVNWVILSSLQKLASRRRASVRPDDSTAKSTKRANISTGLAKTTLISNAPSAPTIT